MTALLDECRLSRLTVCDHAPFALLSLTLSLPLSSHNLTQEIAVRDWRRLSPMLKPTKQVIETLVEDI